MDKIDKDVLKAKRMYEEHNKNNPNKVPFQIPTDWEKWDIICEQNVICKKILFSERCLANKTGFENGNNFCNALSCKQKKYHAHIIK